MKRPCLADESLALEIVSKGAQDYLIKSQVNGPLPLRSLHYAIGRKKAERELRSSEANFRSVIERNADGIVILDHQGVVRFLNPTAETILDRKKEEVLGETFGFPVLAEETTEINIIRRSGSIGWAEMRLVEIVWEGEPAYLAALHDVTERREMDRMKDEFVSVVILILFISGRVKGWEVEPKPAGASPNLSAALSVVCQPSVAAAGVLWPTFWPLGKDIPLLQCAGALPQRPFPLDSTPASRPVEIFAQSPAGP